MVSAPDEPAPVPRVTKTEYEAVLPAVTGFGAWLPKLTEPTLGDAVDANEIAAKNTTSDFFDKNWRVLSGFISIVYSFFK
jgi:hypothetical protein